jgi:hypothetical protein
MDLFMKCSFCQSDTKPFHPPTNQRSDASQAASVGGLAGILENCSAPKPGRMATFEQTKIANGPIAGCRRPDRTPAAPGFFKTLRAVFFCVIYLS